MHVFGGQSNVERLFFSLGEDFKTISAVDACQVKALLQFDLGVMEEHYYQWDRPTADLWTIDGYFLHLMLGARPKEATAIFVDQPGRIPEPIGRLMCVPPVQKVLSSSNSSTGHQRSLLCVLRPEAIARVLGHDPDLQG